MTNKEIHQYDYMVENDIATTDELNLAFNLTDNGWQKTLDDVLFIRTGYRTLKQMLDAEYEEY